MLDVQDQIREYCERLEDEVRPLSAAEILDGRELDVVETRPIDQVRLEPVRPFGKRRRAPGWVYGLAAGILVLLVIGGVAWLVGLDGEPVADDPVPVTSLPATVVTQPQPPVTTAPESADTTVVEVSPTNSSAEDWGGILLPIDDAEIFFADANGIAQLGSTFVVVGSLYFETENKGGVWTSVNGIDWSLSTTVGPSAEMFDVTSGGPGVIAVGATTSPDGSHCFDDDDFAGESCEGAVWTSADGTTWNQAVQDPGTFAGAALDEVAPGGPGFVAIGRACGLDQPCPAIWTSSDGLTWRRVTHDPDLFPQNDQGFNPNHQISAIVAGGPGLVAVGYTADDAGVRVATVWTSADGVTWTRSSPDDDAFVPGSEMWDVTVIDSRLVAVGHVGREPSVAAVWTSLDGIAWTRIPHDESLFGSNNRMLLVANGGPGLVATWDTSGGLWTSPDGLQWTRIPTDPEILFGGTYDLTAGGPGMIAVGIAWDFLSPAVWVSPPDNLSK